METIKKVLINSAFVTKWALEHHLKQSDLSRVLGISPRTYRRYSSSGVFPWAVFKLLQHLIGESGSNTFGLSPRPMTDSQPSGVNK